MSEPNNVAIVVAHPGHELTVYRWMELHRPLYFCLTEGSGGNARSRLESTDRLLRTIGATPGPIHGRYPDKTIYQLLLDGCVDVFVDLAKELADALIAADVDGVAGDAIEGFNPVHDVCRFLIDGAVALVRERTGRVLWNHDFILDGRPGHCPEPLRDRAVWLRLDEAAVERKLAAAFAYPELRDEVAGMVERFGKAAFALECLRPADAATLVARFATDPPAYERYGQIRVTEGRYRDIVRFRPHVFPVRAAIEEAIAHERRVRRHAA